MSAHDYAYLTLSQNELGGMALAYTHSIWEVETWRGVSLRPVWPALWDPKLKKNKMVEMEEINKSVMNGTRMLLGIIEAKFLDMKLE